MVDGSPAMAGVSDPEVALLQEAGGCLASRPCL
jgi:hypothetical protein